jgi:aerobic-type carbon monoxide dehydrogenase small subunit (CoxS/CutS family)
LESLASAADVSGVPAWGEARINGQPTPLTGDPAQPVAQYLRTTLNMRGTKIGCGNGECGACTICVDGEAVCSCILPLHRVDGRAVLTIEGMAVDGGLHAIQAELKAHGAFQCGYCTPGMVMSIHALLRETPAPSEADIRDGLQGNVCRCSGYVKMIEAVQALAARVQV